jgi:hypothetical protein
MSIDTRARIAADGLRESLALVDTPQLLSDLHRMRRQRNRRNLVLAAAAAVVLATIGATSLSERSQTGSLPATHESESGLAPCIPQPTKALACPGDNRWQFTAYPGPRSEVSTSFVVPTALAEATVGPSSTDRSVLVFAGRAVADPTVEVIAQVGAVRLMRGRYSPAPVVVDRSAGTTLESMSQWLADHPGLHTSRVTATTLAGRYAIHLWDVTRVARGDQRAPAPLISSVVVRPDVTTVSQSWFGLKVGMHAEIYLVELSNGNLAAVLYYGYDPSRFAPAEQLVRSLRIGP